MDALVGRRQTVSKKNGPIGEIDWVEVYPRLPLNNKKKNTKFTTASIYW